MEPQTSKAARALGPVLAATDFSETAAVAVEWATELARQQGTRLELVHAVTTPPSMPGYVPTSGLDFTADVRRAAEGRLQELVASLRQAGTEVGAYLDAGMPSQVIVDRAEAVAASAIVLGTRGLTGLRHLLLGSTTERVIHDAPCPVLAIHPQDRGRHHTLRTILVPTDFSEDAELAIATAHRLLAPHEQDARLILVNAFNLPIEYTTYGLLPTSINYLEDTGLEAERRLYELSQRLEREGLIVETVAREGDPAHVITEEAEKRGADLIAMGTHGHSRLRHLLIGSTAERVIQHAPCPVMTIRRAKE
jgi:nucleotide-binding universal stress UspA family protein